MIRLNTDDVLLLHEKMRKINFAQLVHKPGSVLLKPVSPSQSCFESSTEDMLYPIDRFLDYLKIEKIASEVTLRDYYRELFRLNDFLLSKDISNINLISTRILRQYIYNAKESRNLASSSTAKLIAIIKSFFNYLEEDEIIIKNPSRKIKVPKKINKIQILFFMMVQ